MKISTLMASVVFTALLAGGPVAMAAGGGTAAAAQSAGQPTSAIQGGSDIEPTPSSVRSKEQASGVAPPAAQSQDQTAIVEKQVNKLISNSQAGIAALPPGSLPPSR
jgi:hypothetical protein